jgi:hypothetical protein
MNKIDNYINNNKNKCLIIEQFNESFVYEGVQKTHREIDDFFDGNLGDRIEEFSYYNVVKDFNIKSLDSNEWSICEDMVKDYEKMIDEKGISTMPKIVISEDGSIIDGIHRVNALLNKRISKVDLFVGTNQKILLKANILSKTLKRSLF